MNSLSMVEAELPPGFRFHPRDEELVCDYLMNKVVTAITAAAAAKDNNHHHRPPPLIEVDLNKCEPWDIPPIACVGGKEWYFYSQRDKKYATGQRTNRATKSGYWKATGKDRPILEKGDGSRLVGMRKTLVFYQGRAPHGRKTQWVMHEFRLEGPHLINDFSHSPKEDWVLCRMFHKKKEGNIHGGEASRSFHNNDDSTSSSSSLPPLMEPYYLSSFNQTHHPQIMPCFSIFNQNQITPSHMHIINPNNSNSSTYPNMISSSCDHDQKDHLKVVLDHLTGDPPTSSDAESSDNFLSELGLSTMWDV